MMKDNEQLENRYLMIIDALKTENLRLKKLLRDSGIDYSETKKEVKTDPVPCMPNNGVTVNYNMVMKYLSYFAGRNDVYARRWQNKQGKVGYYPQCHNFNSPSCPNSSFKRVSCAQCKNQKFKVLQYQTIVDHLCGRSLIGNDVVGIYPLLKDNTCNFIVYDFDNHEKGAVENDFANTAEAWREEVDTMRRICKLNNIPCLTERSRSGRGAHVWIFFQTPIKASTARMFGNKLLEKGAEFINLKSFSYFDRMMPLQDRLPEGGIGNLIALPLQGRAIQNGNSMFIDENWNVYPDQWGILFNTPKISKEEVEAFISDVKNPTLFDDDMKAIKPYQIDKRFNREDVFGKLDISLANGIFIDAINLQPRIQFKIRRMAVVSNPAFYQNINMNFSNWNETAHIFLFQNDRNYIRLPMGLYDDLIQKCQESNIPYIVHDDRCKGKKIKISFEGELYKSQIPAVEEMSKYDNGLLVAATAFGKTVVCSALIAQKKVNTLILVNKNTLCAQWVEKLHEFLDIDEELPEYKTEKGKIKKRKDLIGVIQGSKDTSTGIIDVGMVGSVIKKGEPHERLKEYGMVILDEAHHAPSETGQSILKEVNAKYVYGVTAQLKRSDNLEKITPMLLGPVRYTYTAKQRANDQGIPHIVIPRFTRAVAPIGIMEQISLNDAYEIIRNNEERTQQIVDDVKESIRKKRTPLVLSKFKDHSQRIFELLQGCADHVYLLNGDISRKDQQAFTSEMKNIPVNESLILVGTGSLIGEGFDFPRLDTLFMATPSAGKSIIDQYAGRLNRDFEGKTDNIIYDYVDAHIPVLDAMYSKRLKEYKFIGYELSGDIPVSNRLNATNAIYDIDSYKDIYHADLKNARREIIISSPLLIKSKIDWLIKNVYDQQKRGVRVIVVSLHPDSSVDDSVAQMRLQEEMRSHGISVVLKEHDCRHYTLIDESIVWYGSMNLLGKEEVDDNLMRITSSNIANEIKEKSFSKESLYPTLF